MEENDGPETGSPVQRVASLELEPEAEFGPRVTRRIHRRLLAGELTDFSVRAFAQTMLEYVLVLFGALKRDTDEEDER